MSDHHDPRNPVASAFYSGVCALDSVGMHLDQLADLTSFVATSDHLTAEGCSAIEGLRHLVEFIRQGVTRDQEALEAQCKAARLASRPAAVA